MPHRFKIVARSNDQYGVQFLYNSEVMVWSESYKSKASARNCIESVQKHAPAAAIVDLSREQTGSGYRFEITPAKNGQFYVRFVAANGEPMVISEQYPDKRNAVSCAESVARNAAGAETLDES